MATTSKNLNIGLGQTPGVFAPLFAAAGTDRVAVVALLGGVSFWGMDCPVVAGEDLLGGGMQDFRISGSPEGRPEAKVSHQENYQTEYGPPIVSAPDAHKRILH